MRITVDITPVPLARPRVNTTNRGRYLPTKSVTFKNKLATLVRQQFKGKPFDVPIAVSIHFYKKRSPIAKNYGDTDNLEKAVLDALKGILWTDDSLIVELHGYKHKDAGKIEIEVIEL